MSVPFSAGPFEATFTSTAEDPGDVLYVTIPDYDGGSGDVTFGPVIWSPQADDTLPTTGDDALVAESDVGRWWVLAWQPA